MNFIKNEKYNLKETAKFKLNFFSLIDNIISSILPIQYEFPLEKIETNIKEEQEYQDFVYSIFIPKLEKFINKNYSHYKIIAIKQKLKEDKLFNKENRDINEIKNLINDESIIIKLNEKSFHEIRNDILNMLFISFINEYSEKNYVINFSNDNNFIEFLPLKSFISYQKINEGNNELDKYEYKLTFNFIDYIKIIINPKLYIQFKFWFYFLLMKVNNTIIEIEYEYYTNFIIDQNIKEKEKDNDLNENDETYLEIKSIISEIFYDYLNFVLFIIKNSNMNKKVKMNINLYLIDNINWIEDLEEQLGQDLFVLEELSRDNNCNINKFDLKQLIFNNLCIKIYGKYSSFNFNNFLALVKDNKLENIIIILNNFNNYEFIEIIQNDENEINDIKQNAIQIFSFLTKFLIKIKKAKLKSITLFIKGFNNTNVLLDKIKSKFDEFMKEIIKQYTIVKNIKIYFSNIYNEERNKKIITNDKLDSIYSLPILNEDEYIKFNIQNKKKKKFKLILFDNNIHIKKNNIIDFYCFEQYSLKKIEELTLGYFFNLSELNRFFKKIKLNELCNMKKFTCFLKSNHKITEKTLSTFFKLDWPKNSLTSIKIIFENFVKALDNDNNSIKINSQYNKYMVELDMYKIYNSLIKENYFKTESIDDIKKIISEQQHDYLNGTMIQDKASDKSLDLKLNIIKTRKSQDKNIIITKRKSENSTNISSYIQQSNNILINAKEPSVNNLLKNTGKKSQNKFAYINDIKSVQEYHNNNFYNMPNPSQYQKYPLKYFLILNSETYLKYFLNNNKKELMKNTYLYNEIVEINNIGKKSEEKYKTYLNFKKSLVIVNNNIRSIFGLIFAVNKTKNKNVKKLLNVKLRYKNIHYEYYERYPALIDYIISFMNEPIFIFNDFKHSNKLFKKIMEE